MFPSRNAVKNFARGQQQNEKRLFTTKEGKTFSLYISFGKKENG